MAQGTPLFGVGWKTPDERKKYFVSISFFFNSICIFILHHVIVFRVYKFIKRIFIKFFFKDFNFFKKAILFSIFVTDRLGNRVVLAVFPFVPAGDHWGPNEGCCPPVPRSRFRDRSCDYHPWLGTPFLGRDNAAFFLKTCFFYFGGFL